MEKYKAEILEKIYKLKEKYDKEGRDYREDSKSGYIKELFEEMLEKEKK